MRFLLIALVAAGCARRAATLSEPTLDEVQAKYRVKLERISEQIATEDLGRTTRR